jgi:hypothetical protein
VIPEVSGGEAARSDVIVSLEERQERPTGETA